MKISSHVYDIGTIANVVKFLPPGGNIWGLHWSGRSTPSPPKSPESTVVEMIGGRNETHRKRLGEGVKGCR